MPRALRRAKAPDGARARPGPPTCDIACCGSYESFSSGSHALCLTAAWAALAQGHAIFVALSLGLLRNFSGTMSGGHEHGRDHEHEHDHDHHHDEHDHHGHDHSRDPDSGHDHAGHDDHAGHHHHHLQNASERRLWWALVILASFTVLEAAGGLLSHSIALLAEAAHMLADCGSLVLAVLAIRVSRRPARPDRTYGHRRYQPLAAYTNGLLLIGITFGVVIEAARRLMSVPEVDGGLMLGVAFAGGVANLGAFLVLSGGNSLNERGARLHVLS